MFAVRATAASIAAVRTPSGLLFHTLTSIRRAGPMAIRPGPGRPPTRLRA